MDRNEFIKEYIERDLCRWLGTHSTIEGYLLSIQEWAQEREAEAREKQAGGINPDSPSGELIGAVYLDERMVWEFSLGMVEETISVINLTLSLPVTKPEERVILTTVKEACEKRMAEESRR